MLCENLLEALLRLLAALLNLQQTLEAEQDPQKQEKLSELIKAIAARIAFLTRLIELLCGPPPEAARK